jgi:hypothetical protein
VGVMDKNMLELYSDFLIASTSLATATALSEITDYQISHDKVTRFLSKDEYTQSDYWKLIKPIVRDIQREDGVICIDDTIEHKPYTDENDIVCYHYDHTSGRSIKGINLLTLFYSGSMALPLRYEIIKKDEEYVNDDGKSCRRSKKTKNELFQEMMHSVVFKNHILFRYVLADSWFASSDTMKYIHQKLKKQFIFAMKSNRLVALTHEDKLQGKFIPLSQIKSTIDDVMHIWIKGVDIPLILAIQHFENEDGSSGILYLVSNDTTLNFENMNNLYHKRWKIEEYHKSMKQNASLEKSPTKIVKTQSNHIFASIYAYVKLELLRVKTSLNHFALKSKIYIKALKSAMNEIYSLRSQSNIGFVGA